MPIEIQETEDFRYLVVAYDAYGREMNQYSRVRDYREDAQEYADQLEEYFRQDREN
jgi:hypothetical protein